MRMFLIKLLAGKRPVAMNISIEGTLLLEKEEKKEALFYNVKYDSVKEFKPRVK